MVEPSKITEKAAEIAGQAAAAAAPIKDKATEVAAAAAAAAGPMAKHAKDRVAGLADRAGEIGAKGVSAAAEGLDAVTLGKFSDKISAVSSRIEGALDPEDPLADTAPPAEQS